MDAVEESYVDQYEVRDMLKEELKKREGAYEQKICLEMLKNVLKTTPAKVKKMREELGKIESLSEKDAALLISLNAKTKEEIELLTKKFSKLSKENIEKISEILQKHG